MIIFLLFLLLEMASTVESLLSEAGVCWEVPSLPLVIWGANAIYNGDLSSLPLDVDQGDLLVQLDTLSETLKEEVVGPVGIEMECEGGIKEEQVEGEGEEGEGQVVKEEEHEIEGVLAGNFEDKNFKKCPYCDQSKHRKSLNRHIKLVHQTVKLTCDQCGLKVTDETKMRLHTEKVHSDKTDQRVKCQFCEKTFSDKRKASYHETTKHQELSENAYQCPACEKKFKTKPNMQRHVRAKHYL